MTHYTHPTFAHGKICYLEISSVDIEQSSVFYQKVFGWRIRKDNHGNISFDDAVGEVSGTWVTGRKPSSDPGVLVSIMVNDMKGTLQLIVENGGSITKEPDNGASEVIAHFLDPSGNLFSLYQHEPNKASSIQAE